MHIITDTVFDDVMVLAAWIGLVTSVVVLYYVLSQNKRPFLFSKVTDYPMLKERPEEEQLSIVSCVARGFVRWTMVVPAGIFASFLVIGFLIIVLVLPTHLDSRGLVALLITAPVFGPIAGYAARKLEVRLLLPHVRQCIARGQISNRTDTLQRTRILLTMMAMLLPLMVSGKASEYLTYENFIRQVEAGNVMSVSLTRFSSISGTFVDGGEVRAFRSHAVTGSANDPLLRQLLREYDVEATISEIDEPRFPMPVLTGLVFLVAPIVFLILLLVIIRKLNRLIEGQRGVDRR